MTLTRITVAVLVVIATTSLAEEQEPLTGPTWSLGAGLSLAFGGTLGPGAMLGGLGGLGGATPGGLGGLSTASASLAPNVSLERMFSSRFALGLGLEGAVTTSATVGAMVPGPSSGSAAIGVSPRFTLTSPSAPVAFTVLATAFTGYFSQGGTSLITPLGEFPAGAQTLTVGALGGIALEKRFLERFAVRIQAQVARVSFNRSWTAFPTQDPSTGVVSENRNAASYVSASFVPSPSIELRLYL